MKKIFSALLALILLFSLCVAVFADEPESLEEYEADVSQLYNVETAADDSDFIETIDETETGDSVQNEVIEVTTDGNSVQDEVVEVTTDEDPIQDEVTDVTAADDSIQTEAVNETAADSSDGAEIAEEADPDSEVIPSVDLAQADTFNVKIAWSGMDFTYVDGNKGTWNPEICDYTGSKQGHWESSDEINNCGKITVTNNTAVAESEDFLSKDITATLVFSQDTDYYSYSAALKISASKPSDWSSVKNVYPSGKEYKGLPAIDAGGESGDVYVMPILEPNADLQALSSLQPKDNGDGYGLLGSITVTIGEVNYDGWH